MVVNSLGFLLFFIVVFAVYYMPAVRQSRNRQNIWLLLTSYFFYGFVDWGMLVILLAVTALFYGLGIFLKKSIDRGKVLMASRLTTLSVLTGIGILLYFKYLNFFAESVANFLQFVGLHASWSTLNIILPVGVSFFTFKLISYVIEIHREKIQPAESFLEFATYISFFPTILSGPIDRPNTFLPQLRKKHTFNYDKAVDGCQQILWGMFTKMVIADNIAPITSMAWNDYQNQSATFLLFAVLLSPVQVYADFDGYSNMAIGVGKILGFDITKNFNHPLLARNVSEYWRRWHMSLTNWITDYVFMPLNIVFRNLGKLGILMAITANLVLIGLWHGANWTYAVFGIFHSILFIPLIYSGTFGKNRKLKENKYGLPFAKDLLMMVVTYLIIGVGHIIFFAKDTVSAFEYIVHMFNGQWELQMPEGLGKRYYVLLLVLFVLEWTSRKKEYALQIQNTYTGGRRWMLYAIDYIVIIAILYLGNFESNQFIYFQF